MILTIHNDFYIISTKYLDKPFAFRIGPLGFHGPTTSGCEMSVDSVSYYSFFNLTTVNAQPGWPRNKTMYED